MQDLLVDIVTRTLTSVSQTPVKTEEIARTKSTLTNVRVNRDSPGLTVNLILMNASQIHVMATRGTVLTWSMDFSATARLDTSEIFVNYLLISIMVFRGEGWCRNLNNRQCINYSFSNLIILKTHIICSRGSIGIWDLPFY